MRALRTRITKDQLLRAGRQTSALKSQWQSFQHAPLSLSIARSLATSSADKPKRVKRAAKSTRKAEASDSDAEIEAKPRKRSTSSVAPAQTDSAEPKRSTESKSEETVASEPSSLEQKYQKLSQREHILKRPEPYIGSVQRETA